MASFINNIIVEMKEEERYNEVIEEVVRSLVKNDLYVKLERCK